MTIVVVRSGGLNRCILHAQGEIGSVIDVRSSIDSEDGSWLLTVSDNGEC